MLKDNTPPRIDQWYLDEGSDLCFTVIEFDSDEGIIEIQYSDGKIGDLDIEGWMEMPLKEIEQPEEWPWPIEELEQSDPDYDDR